MPDEPPLPQRILDATEVVLRRHGPDKANVVDVARALGMSHGNIYRHFASKQALLEAVAKRWLKRVVDPLEAIADDTSRPAPERLSAWFDTLREAKRRKVRDDPELFHVYHNLAQSMPGAVDEHVDKLIGQVAQMIGDGIAAGDFRSDLEPKTAARAFLQATWAFHHPAFIIQDPPPTDTDARAVFDLVLMGMRKASH